jgi:hypothetical protein
MGQRGKGGRTGKGQEGDEARVGKEKRGGRRGEEGWGIGEEDNVESNSSCLSNITQMRYGLKVRSGGSTG